MKENNKPIKKQNKSINPTDKKRKLSKEEKKKLAEFYDMSQVDFSPIDFTNY